MKVRLIVPPTREQGSFTSVITDGYGMTYREIALAGYNSNRAHDGLPPLSRMPNGTQYIIISKGE